MRVVATGIVTWGYILAVPVLLGRFTRWHTLVLAVTSAVGYAALVYLMVVTGLLRLDAPIRAPWLGMIVFMWPLVWLGRRFRPKDQSSESSRQAPPIETLPPEPEDRQNP